MSSFLRVWGVALIFISSCWNLFGQGVIYVDQKANGNMDGSSWQDAYTDLRPAIEVAMPGDAIWVAEGVYRPGDTLQSRYIVDKDIRLLGGFIGSEDLEADRDPDLHKTILSGDVFQNDLPGDLQTNRLDNLFTILEIGPSVTQDATVDGFVFRGGHARGDNTFLTNAWGGAIFCSGAPIIRACRFEDQFAKDRGAAIYIQSNQANNMVIEHCVFVGNESDQDGGAIFINQVNTEGVLIKTCTFDQNKADRRGGAIAVYNGSSTIKGCQFTGNGARQTGGAVQVQASYNQLTNVMDSCSFSQNEATHGGAVSLISSSVFGAVGNAFEVTRSHFDLNESNDFTNNPNDAVRGGAIFLESDVNASETSALITDCTFANNTTAGEGSVLHVQFDGQESSLTFSRNSALANESANQGPLTIFSRELGEAEIAIDSCQFEGNHALEGSAGIIIEATEHAILNMRLTNTTIRDGVATKTSGLALRSSGQATVDGGIVNCSWSGNTGHAIIDLQDGNDQLDMVWQNIRLEGNAVFGPSVLAVSGTGLQQPDEARLRFENILIHHQVGGEVTWQMDHIKVKVQNMTSAENEMPMFGIGDLAMLVLQNTILANAGETELNQVHPNGTVISLGGNVVDDESFQGWLITADQSGIDPSFVSLSTFALSPGSPAIDAGTQPDTIYPYDLAGQDRIQGLAIDAGALESAYTSSINDSNGSGSALYLFPNPASEWVEIQIPGQWDHVDWILLTDLEGRQVLSQSFGEQVDLTSIRFDLLGIMPGHYLITLGDRKGRQATGPLVVVE